MHFVVIILVNLLIYSNVESSLIGNFFSSDSGRFWPRQELRVDKEKVRSKQLPSVTFELPVQNDDSMKEALALISAPRDEIGQCSHRVIMALKKSCNELSLMDEEIGKLAVMLLNCHLEFEGREIFPCQPEMTLRKCTAEMDDHMYQIYNYMKHRAIGICSLIKQDQFRTKTEHSVNLLSETTSKHLAHLNEAIKHHKMLSEMNIDNMKEIQENNQQIQEEHIKHMNSLKIAEDLMGVNIEKLNRELKIHENTEVKLAEMDQVISDISMKLGEQSMMMQKTQEELLQMVEKITQGLQVSNQEISKQYNQTLRYFDGFKVVISFFSSMVENARNFTRNIHRQLEESGITITHKMMTRLMLNLIYFTLGMIFLMFINLKNPKTPKFILISLFVFNIIAIDSDLPLFVLNITTWIGFILIKLIKAAIIKYSSKKSKIHQNDKEESSESSDSDDDQRNFIRKRSTPPAKIMQKSFIKQSNKEEKFEDESELSMIFENRAPTPIVRAMTPAMRRVIKESIIPEQNRSATPFDMNSTGRVQCKAKTAKGLQCRNAATIGFEKCRIHNY